MGTKEGVLALFEANKGIYFSGEEIAGTLHVSRTAVWKAVKALQSEGYQIDGVSNKGYCLSARTDILSSQGIQKYLSPQSGIAQIRVLPSVGSTNALVREKAVSGEREGFVLIAGEQISGAGRTGRSFFSPAGTGIYMSLLLRPENYEPRQAVSLTTIAAVAVCEAIEEVSGEKVQIKWVNDVYRKGKKVCGILTEASFSMENGLLDYAVLGVGINVYAPDQGFPKELEKIAGAVLDRPADDAKNRLAAAFLNHFMDYYRTEKQKEYVEKYRERSMVIGKRVQVLGAGQDKSAMVLGIDDACRLQVEYEDGTRESLSSGEISIKCFGME